MILETLEIKNIILIIAKILLLLTCVIIVFLLLSVSIKAIKDLKLHPEIATWIKILYPILQIAIAIYFTRKGLISI